MTTFEAIDFETTGLEAYKGHKIFAFVITNESYESKVCRFDWLDNTKNIRSEKLLRKFMHDEGIRKIAHNSKFEMGMYAMHNDGVLPPGDWEDTMLQSQLMDNLLSNHKLENLANGYLKTEFPKECRRWDFYDNQIKMHKAMQNRLFNNYPSRIEAEIIQPMYDDGIKPLVLDRMNYGLIPLAMMNGYQIADGERCMCLHDLLYPLIKQDKLLFEDYLNEVKLLRVAQRMEQRGVMLHVRRSNELMEDLEYKVSKLLPIKRKLFGFDINLDSPDQISKHLFGYIDLKKHDNMNAEWKKIEPAFRYKAFSETKTGAPCADKANLLELQKTYPNAKAFDLLQQHRSYTRGVTSIKKYLKLAGDSLIIHPSMNTNEAKTGRQSISNPSLQNVQKKKSADSPYGIPARNCFRPRPGYVYLLGDYSGIEMRLAIASCGDEYLIDQLNKDIDYDVHNYNATTFYADAYTNIGMCDEKKTMRVNSKTGGFGKIYGANFETFRKALNLNREEGRRAWVRFKNKSPELFYFAENMMNAAKKNGYITTAFGRRLYIEAWKAYTAANYKIQGDAAGVLKRAEVNIDGYIQDVHNGDFDLIAMLMTVHDEVMIEMHRSLLENKIGIIHDLSYCMVNVPEIAVPLATEWKQSTSTWHDAKGILV